MMNNPNSLSPNQEAPEIDLGKIFRSLMMQSKLIILFVILCTGLGFANYLLTDRTYKVTSLLQVYPNQQESFTQDLAIDLYMGGSNTTDLDNVEALYKARSNISDIVFTNNLNLGFDWEEENFRQYFKKLIVDDLPSKKSKTLFIKFNLNDYLFGENENNLSKFNYDESVEAFDAQFIISNPQIQTDIIEFKYKSIEDTVKKVAKNFSIQSSLPPRAFYAAKNNGLLEISFLSKNMETGINVVNTANEMFINKNVEIESEQARKAINFIDERLTSVKQELEENKNNLRNFQQTNTTVDVDLEIKSIIDNISSIEVLINEVDIEISKAQNNYTDTNPIYLELLNQKAILENQKTTIENKIKKLPLAQQQYIDLFRDLEISQLLYSELTNRRLGFSIKEASTLGNIRIVDSAYVDSAVSPQITTVFGIMILSFIVAVLLAIFRGLYFIAISNPAELADSYIQNPIIGVIPNIDNVGDKAETELLKEERINQSLESIILNLNNLSEEKELDNTCILLTSATPSNGKSLMSRIIARKYAMLGKKTLLMDCDFKRGTQAKEFNVQKINQNEFLDMNESSLSSYKVEENLYLIPKISRLASSFQFIYTNKFIDQIKFLKKQFDVIIIDTSPFLSVSDTGVLMAHSDFNIAIVRHGLTKINEVKQLINQTKQIGIEYDGIIYNSYEKPSSYYGYYGLYGNYSYQYYAQKYLYNSYDYDK